MGRCEFVTATTGGKGKGHAKGKEKYNYFFILVSTERIAKQIGVAMPLALMTQYQQDRKVELRCRTFQNGTDLLCGMRGGEYDLIFLDVIMPGFSGIGVARELRELDKCVKLVFLTVSPDFAVESYSVGAYHYLLKPATKDDLIWRLSKNMEHVFTPEEIFGAVWGSQPWDGGQMVQMHMSRLRRKLEKAWETHHFIETVGGRATVLFHGMIADIGRRRDMHEAT